MIGAFVVALMCGFVLADTAIFCRFLTQNNTDKKSPLEYGGDSIFIVNQITTRWK